MQLNLNVPPSQVQVGHPVWYCTQRMMPGYLAEGMVVDRKGNTIVAVFPYWFKSLQKGAASSRYDEFCAENRKVFTWRKTKNVWMEHGDSHPDPMMGCIFFPSPELAKNTRLIYCWIDSDGSRQSAALTPEVCVTKWTERDRDWQKKLK